jgi:hypothetical protein
MKYPCSIFYDEKKSDAMPECEVQTLTEEACAFDDVLREGGHFVVDTGGTQRELTLPPYEGLGAPA